MSTEKFIKDKIENMLRDKQNVFKDLHGTINKILEEGEYTKTVHVPADDNWFNISFDAIEIKQDRMVISAKRIQNSFVPCSYDPSEKQYIVEFKGTRAAYLRGYYKARHPLGGWPYISWDVRSYASHPKFKEKRVSLQGFWASQEIRKMIRIMEGTYGTSNIVNTYVNDNLLRFQSGIRANKVPQEIEKSWSKGMMESLGYEYIEANDTGSPKGEWRGVTVHWCKSEQDLLRK